jgi:hypothetical protein
MRLRARDSADIRRDAISMATKKLASGCDSCAEAYVKLARDHGATEAELAPLTHSTNSVGVEQPVLDAPSRISVIRRDIALPSAALTTAVTANAVLPAQAVAAVADPAAEKVKRVREHSQQFRPSRVRTDPFGVDGSTSLSAATVYGMPLQFYIGEMGIGTCSNCGPCGGSCFRTDSANHVGIFYTYGYWGLEGPNSADKGSRTNYVWGQAQADAFVGAWINGPYARYVYGQTFFADIENGFGGWANYNYQANQDVLDGFLDEIDYRGSLIGTTFEPAVYIGLNDINGPNHYYFSPSYKTILPAVFWVTQDQTCAPCAPCNANCNTITDVTNRWNNTIRHACFAGNGAVVWQYWIGCCGCSGDFDYSPQSGNTNFTPVGCS